VSLSLVAIVIGLGAVTPNPLATTSFALITAPIAGIAAGILEFFLLDGVADFPLLAIALAPLVIGAALLMTSPNRLVAVLGRLSLIFTVSIFAPNNPQTYEAQSYVFSFLFVCIATGLLLVAQLLVPPVSGERRRHRLVASARQGLARAPFWDQRYELEEEMFRDAIRIGQIITAGGGASSNAETIEDVLSHFDQTSAIRLCVAKLKAIHDEPLVTKVRAALTSRDPLALVDASRDLRAESTEKPTFADLGAALIIASGFIEAAPTRPTSLKEVA
jgi:hypothetical protein